MGGFSLLEDYFTSLIGKEVSLQDISGGLFAGKLESVQRGFSSLSLIEASTGSLHLFATSRIRFVYLSERNSLGRLLRKTKSNRSYAKKRYSTFFSSKNKKEFS